MIKKSIRCAMVSVFLFSLSFFAAALSFAQQSSHTGEGTFIMAQMSDQTQPFTKTLKGDEVIDYRRCTAVGGVPCGSGCCASGDRCGDSRCYPRGSNIAKDPLSPEQLRSGER